MDVSEMLCSASTPLSSSTLQQQQHQQQQLQFNPLSSEMSLTPTLQPQLQQQTSITTLATPPTTPAVIAAITTPTTPRTTTHTPREIPTMYILDDVYDDDYIDQFNSYNTTIPTEAPDPSVSTELAPCPICSRTFNPVTLRKHVGICEKMAIKKRNTFDSQRQRREGTELATYPLPKNFGLPEKSSSMTLTRTKSERGASPNPRQMVASPIMQRKKPSEDFVRSTARTSMRKLSTSSVTEGMSNSSNFSRDRFRSSERSLTRRGIQPLPSEQCPYCDRCFGLKAYDRHVEWCKEKALQASIKQQPSSKTEENIAKARLEARTKYKAPCLKTKRSVNRDKYSGENEDNPKSLKIGNRTNDIMSMSMTSSITSERKITKQTGNINEASKPQVIASTAQTEAVASTALATPTADPAAATTSVNNRKHSRDISQTSPRKSEDLATDSIANFEMEIEMPDFRLMTEEMTTSVITNNSNKLKSEAHSMKEKLNLPAPPEIATKKSKQQQQQRLTKPKVVGCTRKMEAEIDHIPSRVQKKLTSDLPQKIVKKINFKEPTIAKKPRKGVVIGDDHHEYIRHQYEEQKLPVTNNTVSNIKKTINTMKKDPIKIEPKLTMEEFFESNDSGTNDLNDESHNEVQENRILGSKKIITSRKGLKKPQQRLDKTRKLYSNDNSSLETDDSNPEPDELLESQKYGSTTKSVQNSGLDINDSDKVEIEQNHYEDFKFRVLESVEEQWDDDEDDEEEEYKKHTEEKHLRENKQNYVTNALNKKEFTRQFLDQNDKKEQSLKSKSETLKGKTMLKAISKDNLLETEENFQSETLTGKTSIELKNITRPNSEEPEARAEISKLKSLSRTVSKQNLLDDEASLPDQTQSEESKKVSLQNRENKKTVQKTEALNDNLKSHESVLSKNSLALDTSPALANDNKDHLIVIEEKTQLCDSDPQTKKSLVNTKSKTMAQKQKKEMAACNLSRSVSKENVQTDKKHLEQASIETQKESTYKQKSENKEKVQKLKNVSRSVSRSNSFEKDKLSCQSIVFSKQDHNSHKDSSSPKNESKVEVSQSKVKAKRNVSRSVSRSNSLEKDKRYRRSITSSEEKLPEQCEKSDSYHKESSSFKNGSNVDVSQLGYLYRTNSRNHIPQGSSEDLDQEDQLKLQKRKAVSRPASRRNSMGVYPTAQLKNTNTNKIESERKERYFHKTESNEDYNLSRTASRETLMEFEENSMQTTVKKQSETDVEHKHKVRKHKNLSRPVSRRNSMEEKSRQHIDSSVPTKQFNSANSNKSYYQKEEGFHKSESIKDVPNYAHLSRTASTDTLIAIEQNFEENQTQPETATLLETRNSQEVPRKVQVEKNKSLTRPASRRNSMGNDERSRPSIESEGNCTKQPKKIVHRRENSFHKSESKECIPKYVALSRTESSHTLLAIEDNVLQTSVENNAKIEMVANRKKQVTEPKSSVPREQILSRTIKKSSKQKIGETLSQRTKSRRTRTPSISQETFRTQKPEPFFESQNREKLSLPIVTDDLIDFGENGIDFGSATKFQSSKNKTLSRTISRENLTQLGKKCRQSKERGDEIRLTASKPKENSKLSTQETLQKACEALENFKLSNEIAAYDPNIDSDVTSDVKQNSFRKTLVDSGKILMKLENSYKEQKELLNSLSPSEARENFKLNNETDSDAINDDNQQSSFRKTLVDSEKILMKLENSYKEQQQLLNCLSNNNRKKMGLKTKSDTYTKSDSGDEEEFQGTRENRYEISANKHTRSRRSSTPTKKVGSPSREQATKPNNASPFKKMESYRKSNSRPSTPPVFTNESSSSTPRREQATKQKNASPIKKNENYRKPNSRPSTPPVFTNESLNATPRSLASCRSYTIQSKLETNTMKSLNVCQSKRTKVVRQTASCSSRLPMKAMPFNMETNELHGVSSAPQILSNLVQGDKNDISQHNVFRKDDNEFEVLRSPPVSQLKRNTSFTISGLPDNYDPFLSAKRQLEELCSPIDSPTTTNAISTPQTPQLPSLPATPAASANKMSTSLILSSSTPQSSSPMTTSQIPTQTSKTPTLARSSSFRRTGSLRCPRRSPLLTQRVPLFAQKHRPSIQRGLSDEGPISNNFMKPEEYDEMPVRSVCVNDYAVTKSPRVVRRDTSASNRKQPLKLNINAANEVASTENSNSNTPNAIGIESAPNTASRYVNKTDSLAVFLKYEHELEKLNKANNADVKKESTDENANPTATSSIANTPLSNLDGPLNAKELKDKSNNLSKQNSAKNIKADLLDHINDNTEITESQLNNKPISTPLTSNTSDTTAMPTKYGSVRLAPLSKPSTPLNNPNTHLTKPSTPLTKPSTPLTKPTTPLTKPTTPLTQLLTPLTNKTTLLPLDPIKPQLSQKPVALSALFGSAKNSDERKNSLGPDYIDPKLINKCDNLPVNLNKLRNEFKHSDSDTSDARLDHFSSSSSESSAAPTKFLPSVKPDNIPNNTNQNNQPNQQPQVPPSMSQRNSAEGRNLLKRRMRLGRNQFLYDASPEADSCSADDEANRSSMECENFLNEHETTFDRLSNQINNPLEQPFIPPPTLPAEFDDFDFEEFLSSFENDEEQFPLFKDCREFLLNRTSKKQRSMLMPNSNVNVVAPQSKEVSTPQQQTFPPLTPQHNIHHHSQQHFQFPNLPQHPKELFESFSLNSKTKNRYNNNTSNASKSENVAENQKREIFISIETEQNDLDRSPISPNSIRHMMGNPQCVVEVEVDAADNKFCKISDDDDELVDRSHMQHLSGGINRGVGAGGGNHFNGHFIDHHLPNVQLNNAKNLIQKMQEDFRQMGEEMSTNLRQSLEQQHQRSTVQQGGDLMTHQRNKMNKTTGTPSGDAYGDSDELSSLDGYPLSSPNSRLGVSSKTSADSAYGSLSRQRSSELSNPRNSSRHRPITSTPISGNTMMSRPLTEERSRQLSASSSSSSEHALPPIGGNNNYQKQQQQHLTQLYNNNNNNNNNINVTNDLDDRLRYERNNNNFDPNPELTPTSPMATLQHHSSNHEAPMTPMSTSTQLLYASNSTMNSSMKMSKFCHECGNRFLLEHAKFCMDCGVKRICL